MRALVDRVDASLETIEALPESASRLAAADALEGLLELYGEGMARIIALVARRCGPAAIDAMAGDELLSHLLMLHGLHPVDARARVLNALREVRPALASHGGDVELIGVEGSVARVRLKGSCDGCPSSASTLKATVEEAIFKAAPDIVSVESEGVSPPAAAAVDAGFVPLAALGLRGRAPVAQKGAA